MDFKNFILLLQLLLPALPRSKSKYKSIFFFRKQKRVLLLLLEEEEIIDFMSSPMGETSSLLPPLVPKTFKRH